MKKRHIILLDFLFICVLLFLLGFSYLSYKRIDKLKNAADWVNHSSLVKLNVILTLNHVIDAESGQRGYLLTRDTIFLNQYNKAMSKVDDEMARLIFLVKDNKSQYVQVLQLQRITNSRLAVLKEINALSQDKNATEADAKTLVRKGKMIRELSRTVSRKIIADEQKLLERRAREKDSANSLTPIFVLIFSVFAIVFVITAYIKMRSETTLRISAQVNAATSRKLQEEGAKLNQLLESKVTERTRELEQKNISLENMNDELLSFNYVASHDLQEPLRKIQAFSNRIMDSDETFSQTTRDYFERITAAAYRMQKLLDALISYSRANNTEQDFTMTDLNVLLGEVKTDIGELIDEKKTVINSEELPSINGITHQLHQLFVNLIANSIKYSKPEVTPEINIRCQKVDVGDIKKTVYLHDKSYWKITFEDNGIGFESQYEDKIFELFQRLHGRNEFEGTGIGLAICKKIVQNHNGYIAAEGRPGRGATFFIYFPA